MKALHLAAVSALALTATACGPKVPAARAALECPMEQGGLTRTGAAPDGKACTYATKDGAEVTLQLVSTVGGVDSALGAIEKNLLSERAKTEPKPADEKASEKGVGKAAAESPAGVTVSASLAADKAAKEAAADTKGLNIDVKVDGKPASGNSEVTTVDLPGVHIVANEKDDTAKVRIGPINIDAGGEAATIRIRRDVRLRGEALNPEKRGLRASFIYTGEDLPSGYRFVGYEAGGPKRGPITVAVVKSKMEDLDESELHKDVKKLVRMNGGV